MVPLITHVLNRSFAAAIVPDAFKSAIIHPINNGVDGGCVNNYRPISVLPALSKILRVTSFTKVFRTLQHTCYNPVWVQIWNLNGRRCKLLSITLTIEKQVRKLVATLATLSILPTECPKEAFWDLHSFWSISTNSYLKLLLPISQILTHADDTAIVVYVHTW